MMVDVRIVITMTVRGVIDVQKRHNTYGTKRPLNICIMMAMASMSKVKPQPEDMRGGRNTNTNVRVQEKGRIDRWIWADVVTDQRKAMVKDKEQSRLILNSGTCNRGENARHLRSYGMRSVGGTRQLQTCSLTPSPTPVRAACRPLFGACLSRRRRRRRAACPTPRPPRMSAWSCNTRLCTSRNTVHGRFLSILLKQCASKPTRGSPSCAFWAARTCETCT